MELKLTSLRKSINKAYLKEVVDRPSFNRFKTALAQLSENIHAAGQNKEHEEHFKNFLAPFLNQTGFKDYYINTSGRIDLAIHNGAKGKSPVGVLIEVKRPSNKNEMITGGQLNRKAMHEAVLYYLEQRIEDDNTDLKQIIITNMWQWFVFDAQEFERFFYKPSALRKTYKAWKNDQKVSSNNDFMYREIARFMASQNVSINGIHINLRDEVGYLKAKENSEHEKKLIPLYKFFSPVQLLKEPFANDSNNLNREFYRELLYILGLEETKDGSTRYIERVGKEDRRQGSLIENTIRILESENRLSQVEEPEVHYGKEQNDQLFNVAMELCITWINRILFLKLLEAQLFRYHRQARLFRFLNTTIIDDYDELNKLFFQVLARREEDRTEDITQKYGHIPYLNSSLFEVTTLEYQAIVISGLDDHAALPVYPHSVLADQKGSTLNTLEYLFRFLDAYDFSAEKGEEIRPERKSLINASVLGLIFEKINGYKDGSFYTPGFITEYMARETLRKAVVDKFVALAPQTFSSKGEERFFFTDIYNAIGRDISVEKANDIINSITICDPAVGSGHFLVSCLNELLAIKSELGILCDSDGKRLRDVNVAVENDELIITVGDEELFEYDVAPAWSGTTLTQRKVAPERQRIQQTLFREKRHIIENGLFGVDINANSVKICRLRLWIELLKQAYYTEESSFMKLEVLPNIDINIKQGNSLVSRFELDVDLKDILRDTDYTLQDYRKAVADYKEIRDAKAKRKLRQLIDETKNAFTVGLEKLHPERQKLKTLKARLIKEETQKDMFGDDIEEGGSRSVRIKDLEHKIESQQQIIADLEAGAFYRQAFEWRFEFPEVLDEDGRFTGFDVVIGNPPYIRQEELKELKDYFKTHYAVYQGTADLYSYFIEQGMKLLRHGGAFHYIVSNKWMRANYGKSLRKWMQQYQIESIIDFGDLPVFEEATTYPCLLQLRKAAQQKNFEAVEVEHLDFVSLSRYLDDHHFEVDQTKLQIKGWALIDKRSQKLLEKLKQTGMPLGEYIDGKIYRGVVTGLNEVFVINEEQKHNLLEQDKNSAEVIYPVLKGRNVKRYSPLKSNQYLIYLERSQNLEKFPAIKEHLETYREHLEPKPKDWQGNKWPGRASGNYKWFETQSAFSNYAKWLNPKIIYPDLSNRCEFTIDQDGKFLGVNTTYVIASDELALLGILNSGLIEFYYQNISSSYRGGYLRFFTQYVETIPITVPKKDLKKEIESLVTQILTAKRGDPEADTGQWEAEIDRLVYELYGLNEQEIAIVEGR